MVRAGALAPTRSGAAGVAGGNRTALEDQSLGGIGAPIARRRPSADQHPCRQPLGQDHTRRLESAPARHPFARPSAPSVRRQRQVSARPRCLPGCPRRWPGSSLDAMRLRPLHCEGNEGVAAQLAPQPDGPTGRATHRLARSQISPDVDVSRRVVRPIRRRPAQMETCILFRSDGRQHGGAARRDRYGSEGSPPRRVSD